MPKIKFKSFFEEVRLYLPYVIWIIAIIVAVIKFKEIKSKTTQVQTIQTTIEVPKLIETIKWKEKILWKTTEPDTVYRDTLFVNLPFSYDRPWGILQIEKNDRKLSATEFRLAENNEMMELRKEVWHLRTGKTFSIVPRDNVNNPFLLKEHRDLFDWRIGGGLSASDKVYFKAGFYVNAVQFGKVNMDIGLCSYVSFPKQDICIDFILR